MSTKLKALLNTIPKGQEVTVQGWVRTFRANRFIALNDGSTQGTLQCVVDFENFDEDLLKQVTTGSALKITGRYVESQGKGQKAEIQAEKLHVYGSGRPRNLSYSTQKAQF